MELKDKVTLAAILTVFVLVALWLVPARASDANVPGDLTVDGSGTFGGNVVVDLKLSVGDTMSCLTYNCADIQQLQIIQWNESVSSGLAYPDTFRAMTPQAVYAPPFPATIEYVTLFMDDAGADWDSLKVDVLAGADGDTSVFSAVGREPMLEAADGDRANTGNVGRSGTMSPTMKVLDKGEVVYLDAHVYGTKGDPPAGIIVWLHIKPDYQQD